MDSMSRKECPFCFNPESPNIKKYHLGVDPKIGRDVSPKMDGEHKGKPY